MAQATSRLPLELISAAVAGEDLRGLAEATSGALGCPVAVVIPALGEPVAAPQGAIAARDFRELVRYAGALIADEDTPQQPAVAEVVPVRIGPELVGIVAAVADPPAVVEPPAAPLGEPDPVPSSWLEVAAAASSITALMRTAQQGGLEGSRRALLQALRAGAPANVEVFVSHGQRLGFDLSAGAIAFCARQRTERGARRPPAGHRALLAELGDGRLYGLVPLASTLPVPGSVEALAGELRSEGREVALSAPRRDPAALHDAVREAELLLELGACSPAHDQTVRLLVGILFRDRDELERLRAQTISPLVVYDSEHDTELVATLQEFLLHHGSTTETAEAMRLHRHTVGYRLARVQEVSGLSPYESDGRERLSLGLKAHQILDADEQLSKLKPG